MFKASICVYCGSRPGHRAEYIAAAEAFGAAIARAGYRLVYGAGDVGIMGAVARAVQDAGGATFGVIPEHLVRAEVGKTDLTTYIVTETMHERKKVMFMNSDAVVLFPGGAGSLDELFEVLTWRQLGLHEKPILLVDIAGYWQPLLEILEHVVREGFADASLLGFVDSVPDVEAAMDYLETRLQQK